MGALAVATAADRALRAGRRLALKVVVALLHLVQLIERLVGRIQQQGLGPASRIALRRKIAFAAARTD
jgi:hypothetical protein